ncbi:MAG TPA: hypothetical protein DIU35_04005 [Candidatus Latescibacteria bacterium]|nr:hypothetical protein [Gemmatimonadota bacterium]HCR16626.1 hypothetical protein [Candidatus Latescibacterota bacterium]
MKFLIASFAHETNTFSSVPTDLAAFKAQSFVTGEEVAEAFTGTSTTIGGFLDVIANRGDEAIYTVSASATPSGLVAHDAYETIAGLILDGVRNSPDVDGILLALHGAMVVEGFDDGEGELLRRIREIVGYDLPVVVVLDLHSHITEHLIDAASVVIGYQKYPHTDTYERGVEAAELIARIVRGEVNPVSALRKPAMIPVCGKCHTQEGLYKELWEEALGASRPTSVISTSLFAGFSYADIPPMGYAVLVYADGDVEAANAEADRLADLSWSRRDEFLYTPTSIEEAVSQAIEENRQPVVIADIADNPGGGSSNDGVEVLRELIRQGVNSAAVGTVYDPDVVVQAIEAGVGGRMTPSLGAKTDTLHGEPVDIEARVVSTWDGRFQYKGPMTTGSWASLGDCAVLDIGGILVIVASKRLQCRDPEIFRAAGIDPMARDILVVKSAVHFRAAFVPFAAKVIIADGPGLTSLDLTQFEYSRIRRPLFPLDV